MGRFYSMPTVRPILTTLIIVQFVFVHPVSADELKDVLEEASAAYKRGAIEQALKLYHKAATLAPDSTKIRTALGVIAVQAGATKLAEKSFRAVLSVNPKHLDARYNLGLLLSEKKKFREAIVHLKKAVTYAPKDSAPKFALASAYIGDGALKSAQNVLQKITPRNGAVLSMSAFIAMRQGQWTTALETAKNAEASNPDSLKLVLLKLTAMIHAGQNKKATPMLKSLIRKTPRTLANVPYLLALSSFLDGQWTSAKQWFDEAAVRAPGAFVQDSPQFDPNAFPTHAELTFLDWGGHSKMRAPQAVSIHSLRVSGNQCHPAPLMVALANANQDLGKCIKAADKTSYTLEAKASDKLDRIKVSLKTPGSTCLAKVLSQLTIKAPTKTVCNAQFRITATQ